MKIFPLYLLPLLLLLCGCTVDVDYTGQKFPVDKGNYNVKYFKSRQELDLDKYAIIGRFVVTAPARTDHYAFQKILMEKAMEFGGDAVCLVEASSVIHGAYTSNDDEFGAPHPGTPAPEISPSQRGIPEALTGEKVKVRRQRVKALLLKERTVLNQLLK